MKKLLIILSAVMFLNACSGDSPPIYKSDMTKKQYGEQFGDWLGGKLSKATEADIERYDEKSTELVKSFKEQAKHTESSEKAVILVDTLMSQIINMTKSHFNLSQSDWEFIADPNVDKSASNHSKWEVKFMIGDIFGRLSLSGFGYFPTTIPISKTLKDKKDGEIYYSVLKNSKYSKIIANDEWAKDYEDRSFIIKSAMDIAKNDTLYFDTSSEVLKKYKRQKKHLEFDYKFEVINSHEVIGDGFFGKSIFDLKKAVDSKSKKDYEREYKDIIYAKNRLKSSRLNLTRKIEYLKRNPNKLAEDSVSEARVNVSKSEENLNKSYTEFNALYDNEIEKLNTTIGKLGKLESQINSLSNKYNHNIQVFFKTYTELMNKNIENYVVAESLSGSRTIPNLKNYKGQKNINFEYYDKRAFDGYIKIMSNLLNKSDKTK